MSGVGIVSCILLNPKAELYEDRCGSTLILPLVQAQASQVKSLKVRTENRGFGPTFELSDSPLPRGFFGL